MRKGISFCRARANFSRKGQKEYQTHLTRIVYIVSCSQSFYGFVFKEVGRNTPLRLVYLPTLLSCFSHFLRALQQNEAQSWPLYLLISIAIG